MNVAAPAPDHAGTNRWAAPTLDVGCAVVLALLMLPSSLGMLADVGPGAVRRLCAGAMVVLQVLPATGRRWPRSTFAAGCAAAAVLTVAPAAHVQGVPVPLVLAPGVIGFFVGLYWIARAGGVLRARVALGLSLAGGVMVLLRLTLSSTPLDRLSGSTVVVTVAPFAASVAAWALGRLHGYTDHDRERAAAAAAMAERARIAAEIHDVVSHSLAVMVSQAEGGRMLARDERLRQVLARISDTGRAALTDMRSTLGVLRGEREAAPAGPQPGVNDLPELVSQAGARLTRSGTPAPLSPGVELAAYRIVQESLTNALKHGAGPVTVAVDWVDDPGVGTSLRLRVTNPTPSARTGRGSGLVGMRQRARAAGGRLQAGPVDGVWQVEAHLGPAGEDGPR